MDAAGVAEDVFNLNRLQTSVHAHRDQSRIETDEVEIYDLD
jgi:hypothetical protein